MDPYNVLYQFPELLAAMVTDICKDHARCRVIVKFCGKSANMTFAYTEMIERIRDAVKIYCRRKGLKTNANEIRPTVSYNVRVLRKRTYIDLDDDILTFEQLDGMPGTLTKTLVNGVELDVVVVKAELMKRGIQTYKLRKAIQKKNARNNEDYKVTPLFRNPGATCEPSLSVAQTEKLIRKYISYDDLRGTIWASYMGMTMNAATGCDWVSFVILPKANAPIGIFLLWKSLDSVDLTAIQTSIARS